MKYLVSLAVSEGLHEAVDALGPSLPVVKKPRLDSGAQTPSPNVVLDALHMKSDGLVMQFDIHERIEDAT